MTALRGWSPTAQVGLLFVVLFGLLAAASATLSIQATRETLSPARRVRLGRWRRELAALWTGALLFWVAWVSGRIGATLLFAMLSFLALREYITLVETRRSDHRNLILAFFVVLPLQYVLVAGRHLALFTVFVPVGVFLAMPVVSALAGDAHRFLERNAKIQWGLMVCVYGLSHAPALLTMGREQAPGAFLLFFLVVVTVGGQLGCRWAADRLPARPASGDRRLAPKPVLAACAAGALLGLALAWITPFEAWRAGLFGAAAAGSGTLGDAVMRALRRDAGTAPPDDPTEDPENGTLPRGIVTGAVGLFERTAALCYAAPVFFHLVRWGAPGTV